MFKFKSLVCALLVFGMTTYAFGEPCRIVVDDIQPVGDWQDDPSDDDDDEAGGRAVLKWKPDKGFTKVRVSLEEFLPNTLYNVDVVTGFGGPTIFVNTDDDGDGIGKDKNTMFDLTLDGFFCCATVTVYIDANNDFFPQEDEIRAFGANCP